MEYIEVIEITRKMIVENSFYRFKEVRSHDSLSY